MEVEVGAWAFATANQAEEELFAAMASAAERRVGEFNAQSVANIEWALAIVGWSDAPLFAVLAELAEQCVADYNA